MNQNCEFYVYAHYRKSDGRIFYIGKGKKRRWKSLSGRSERWNNTVLKNGGFSAKKLYELLTEECAYSIEKMLINSNRKKLCNFATGGHGTTGSKFSEDTRRKVSQALTGRKVSNLVRKTFLDVNRKKVICSDGRIFNSVQDAAVAVKGDKKYASNISACARGRTHHAYGFGWSFNISKIPEKFSLRKSVKCIEHGIIFESLASATQWVASWRGACPEQAIKNSLISGKKVFGITFVRVGDWELK